MFGLIRAGVEGWDAGEVVLSFAASTALLVAFVISQIVQTHPMFDLALLRKPTFTGGLIAAFGVSASVFSLLTYLVIYVQNVLGYSAVGAGVRFLFLSAASFVAASIAGRLTASVPTRWMIGPGFLVLGVGLALLLRIEPSSDWTALIPGLIVSGLAVGMINVPLASTAVGVVHPDRSGMASGVNSTFRQVGIATGIAALGSIFSHEVADGVRRNLAGTPAAADSDRIADAVTGGQVQRVLEAAPADLRGTIAESATTSFVDALDHITTIAMVLAFVAGIACLVLIRQKDFEVQSGSVDEAERTPVAG